MVASQGGWLAPARGTASVDVRGAPGGSRGSHTRDVAGTAYKGGPEGVWHRSARSSPPTRPALPSGVAQVRLPNAIPAGHMLRCLGRDDLEHDPPLGVSLK